MFAAKLKTFLRNECDVLDEEWDLNHVVDVVLRFLVENPVDESEILATPDEPGPTGMEALLSKFIGQYVEVTFVEGSQLDGKLVYDESIMVYSINAKGVTHFFESFQVMVCTVVGTEAPT